MWKKEKKDRLRSPPKNNPHVVFFSPFLSSRLKFISISSFEDPATRKNCFVHPSNKHRGKWHNLRGSLTMDHVLFIEDSTREVLLDHRFSSVYETLVVSSREGGEVNSAEPVRVNPKRVVRKVYRGGEGRILDLVTLLRIRSWHTLLGCIRISSRECSN